MAALAPFPRRFPVHPVLAATVLRFGLASLSAVGVRVDEDADGEAAVAEAERVARLAGLLYPR
jgi:hypothetical protein